MNKEFNDTVCKENKIPDNVRKTLDQTYERIRIQSKKKKKHIVWTRMATAACCLLLVGIASTSEPVKAAISGLLNFDDAGIEQARNAGFADKIDRTVTNQDIQITLDSHFADNNKMGFSFQLLFEDPTLLGKEVEFVNLDYRLKNGDGEYIMEQIPDTKPLYGKNEYAAGGLVRGAIIDYETGKAQFDAVYESKEGYFPPLVNAIVEVESIKVFYANGDLKKFNGEWNLPLNEKATPFEVVNYVAKDSETLHVMQANGNPTSIYLTIAVDGEIEDETPYINMKMMDEKGTEYESGGISITREKGQTIISTTFPISTFGDSEKLQLIVGDERVELNKNQ